MDEIQFVGITEQYSGSLELLRRKFPFVGYRSMQRANVAEKPVFTRDDLTPEVLDQLLELNQPDIAFYDAAKERFEECVAFGI